MRVLLPGLCVVILLMPLLTPESSADSIAVQGKIYTDVFIRASSSLYYIQDPSTGSIEIVYKENVNPADVHFSKPAEREAILEAFRKKREAVGNPLPAVEPIEIKPVTLEEPEIVEAPPPVPQLTNIPNKLQARRQGRKLFVSGEGVGVMTNQPERFRGDREYVEVLIHYDPIMVPKEFGGGTPSRLGPDVPDNLPEIVSYYAKHYKLDEELVYAVIKVESNGNPNAVSHAGARGLMQLMPPTAAEMGVTSIFDPAQNIAGGTQYLAKMLQFFDNDEVKALAAYNAGPGRVKRYNGIPPIKETQNYVRKVLAHRRAYQRSGLPEFDVSNVTPIVTAEYLPPESAKYYRIKLFNGLTLTAEGIRDEGDKYIYVFEGRSGSIPKSRVHVIYEPDVAD